MSHPTTFDFPTTSLTTILTASTMAVRDYLQEIEIKNAFFSSTRSCVVIGIAEVGFALFSLIGIVEIIVRAVIEEISNTIAYYSSEEGSIKKCRAFSKKIAAGRREASYFCLANLFAIYLNLVADNLKERFKNMNEG